MGKALAVVCVLAGTAFAQQAQWVRLSLNDGRFVDGYITGGDAISYFVQTSYGYFSIVRTNVIAVTPMGPAPVAAPPTQTVPLAPPPTTENPYKSKAFGRGVGVAYFAISYGVVALAASAKVDDDASARTGYIPVVGPILWAWADDEDDVGEDGWDWLAVLGTVTQGAGVYLAITGGEREETGPKLTAVSTKSYSGLAVVGSW